MSQLVHDIGHAARSLRRSPGFLLVTVVTLALGIGATSAIFSLVHGVAIRPLSFPEPERLLWLDHGAPGAGFDDDLGSAAGLFTEYARRSRTLESLGFWRDYEVTLIGAGDPERVRASETTHGLFTALRLTPLHGRLFGAADDPPGAERVAILSHRLWQRRYGSDPGIVGRGVELSGNSFTVVGILPPGFELNDSELWLSNNWNFEENFGGFSGSTVARMVSGVAAEDVRRELDSFLADLEIEYSNADVQRLIDQAQVHVIPVELKEHIVGPIQRTLWILLGTVGFVLLAACANVANLFLVRAEARQRETAVRMALGAGRGKLARFFMTESLLLALLGGATGLLVATAGVRLLVRTAPVTIPRLASVSVDTTVLAFAAAITLLTGLLFGSVPVLRRVGSLSDALRDGGRSATAGTKRVRMRQLLVVSQVALALILLAGAALTARSFWQLRSMDPGFDADHLLTFQIALPGSQYESLESAVAFHIELLANLRALPGVESVGGSRDLALGGLANGEVMTREDKPPAEDELPPVVWMNRATEDYFATLRIPLLAGRVLTRADLDEDAPVTVISRAAANLVFPGEDPIGKRIAAGMGEEDPRWLEVIGVVGNTKQSSLTEEPQAMAYMTLAGGPSHMTPQLSYALRTEVEPLSLADTVRRTVWSMDPDLPLVRLRSMQQAVDAASAPMAFTMILLGLAAGVTMLLGAVGIYGVIAYLVRQRTSEIGVRMALGARGTDVRRMMVSQSAVVAGLGLLIGLGATLLVVRTLETLLYGVDPYDPLTHMAVTALLLAIVLIASWLPARRAARVDPRVALRGE